MRALGFILAACVALAVARAITAALLAISLLAILLTVIRYPRETIGFVIVLTVVATLGANPLASALAIPAIIAFSALQSRRP